MIIQRASHWVLGTAMAALVLHVTFLATAESLVGAFDGAFEPEFEGWDLAPDMAPLAAR